MVRMAKPGTYAEGIASCPTVKRPQTTADGRIALAWLMWDADALQELARRIDHTVNFLWIFGAKIEMWRKSHKLRLPIIYDCAAGGWPSLSPGNISAVRLAGVGAWFAGRTL